MSPHRDHRLTRRYRTLFGLGIALCVLGFCAFVLGIVEAAIAQSSFRGAYSGIWGGLFICAAGVTGILGGYWMRKIFTIASLALCVIVSSLISIVILACALRSMVWDSWRTSRDRLEAPYSCVIQDPDHFQTSDYVCLHVHEYRVNAALAMIAILASLLSIIAATFGCCLVCRCCGAVAEASVEPYDVVVFTTPPPTTGGGAQPSPRIVEARRFTAV